MWNRSWYRMYRTWKTIVYISTFFTRYLSYNFIAQSVYEQNVPPPPSPIFFFENDIFDYKPITIVESREFLESALHISREQREERRRKSTETDELHPRSIHGTIFPRSSPPGIDPRLDRCTRITSSGSSHFGKITKRTRNGA